MQKYSNAIINTTGAAVASATVTIKDGGTANVSTIYSDNGNTTTANPLTSDSSGAFAFWAANGVYDIHVVSGSFTQTLAGVVLLDPFAQGTADTAIIHKKATVATELVVPTSAPASPAAGDIWELSGILKHGSSSKVVADIAGSQTFSGSNTFSSPIISTVTTGTAPLIIASTTVVANLQAATAAALATGATVTLAQLPAGTANQILGTNSGATAIEQKSLAVGTAGTDFAIVHTANTVTYNLPDAGASARGPVTTGTQTFAGAKTFSGAVTPTGGLAITGPSFFSTVPIGSVPYGTFGHALNPVAGTIYIAEVFVTRNFTATGIAVLNAGIVGTNKYIVGLYVSAGGAAVANSDLAGTTTATAVSFQSIPFTGTYALIGPARYWIGVQVNGATDNFETVAISTFILLTKSFTGSFGTLGSLTVPTTFTANVGPIAYIY